MLSTIALKSEPKIVNVALQLNRTQRPYASRGIFARVRCDGACLIGANAVVTVGGAKPFTDYSSLYHLNERRHEDLQDRVQARPAAGTEDRARNITSA